MCGNLIFYNPSVIFLRKSILSATHPSPNGDTFSHKRRLINLSLSVLYLHQSIVGSIDYGSLLQWEKVAERSEVG